ncbi:dormancy-associated protein homolog 3 isoform X2 [Amborella trichopoda]|uniref:dormancy-associated protein homolog 3 isoform X2 n=1 Tax=Amborella trichopoda TaxID=13333 RepID=UPI0005D32E5E|nr:dormancy-associated protein homolog 3 isoform X2 [Amborella trichopoda]|eukprot:XP_011623114.1 dormancy-associated protein homolog 3 isoform X2 [Amborella trichopoda]
MGLLDKLWDDTLAGPQPDNGLSKLRKYSSFTARSSSDEDHHHRNQVSHSITIKKPSNLRNLSLDSASTPSTPSSAPESPGLWTPRGDLRRFRMKSTSEALEKAEPRSPTVVVISALDR